MGPAQNGARAKAEADQIKVMETYLRGREGREQEHCGVEQEHAGTDLAQKEEEHELRRRGTEESIANDLLQMLEGSFQEPEEDTAQRTAAAATAACEAGAGEQGAGAGAASRR